MGETGRGFYEAVDIVGLEDEVFGLSPGKGAEMAERSVTAGETSVWLLGACGALRRKQHVELPTEAEPQLPLPQQSPWPQLEAGELLPTQKRRVPREHGKESCRRFVQWILLSEDNIIIL